MVSLGGNTMDMVVAVPPRTECLQKDGIGDYLFRVYQRFALRLKDDSAVMRFDFAAIPAQPPSSEAGEGQAKAGEGQAEAGT
jgi:hypothetical protein